MKLSDVLKPNDKMGSSINKQYNYNVPANH